MCGGIPTLGVLVEVDIPKSNPTLGNRVTTGQPKVLCAGYRDPYGGQEEPTKENSTPKTKTKTKQETGEKGVSGIVNPFWWPRRTHKNNTKIIMPPWVNRSTAHFRYRQSLGRPNEKNLKTFFFFFFFDRYILPILQNRVQRLLLLGTNNCKNLQLKFLFGLGVQKRNKKVGEGLLRLR